jgi:hypothetical protein
MALRYPQMVNTADQQHSVHIRIYSSNTAPLGGGGGGAAPNTGQPSSGGGFGGAFGQLIQLTQGGGFGSQNAASQQQCINEDCLIDSQTGKVTTTRDHSGAGEGGSEPFKDPPYGRATETSEDQIWLPFPQSIQMSNGWNWESVTRKKTILGSVVDGDLGETVTRLTTNVGAVVMKVMEENADRGAYHDKGMVLNPRTQTMFSDPIMRTYSFEWDIAPKNASESNDVENIIRKLKYHGAPSLAKEDGSIYAYPSEFQVLFFSKGGENKFIGRMDRCALTSVDVNYTNANMVSMFKNSHAPTHLKLTLQFTELQLQSRENLMEMDGQGGGYGGGESSVAIENESTAGGVAPTNISDASGHSSNLGFEGSSVVVGTENPDGTIANDNNSDQGGQGTPYIPINTGGGVTPKRPGSTSHQE